jgi:hypothetical protein
MNKPTIILANDHHRDRAVISMKFEKDHTLISRVKTLPAAKWSQSKSFVTNAQKPLLRKTKRAISYQRT